MSKACKYKKEVSFRVGKGEMKFRCGISKGHIKCCKVAKPKPPKKARAPRAKAPAAWNPEEASNWLPESSSGGYEVYNPETGKMQRLNGLGRYRRKARRGGKRSRR